MFRRFSKTDCFFIISLITGMLLLSVYLFTYPFLYDEPFYATIPYRLINGDSLIQHEWHLSQFSSLFSYLPVRLWLTLKGSSEGIIVFLRCVYFLIHTAATVTIYSFFRKYGGWAIATSMLFFTQTPYRIFGISYNSMFVLFTLFFTLCLLSVHKNPSRKKYIFAGLCFGCCCICNPLYCFAFLLYLFACVIWTKKDFFINRAIRIKTWYASKTKKNIHKKQAKKKIQITAFPNTDSYNCFFCKEAVTYFSVGIFIIAVIAVTFFFATGGTLQSAFENMKNLFASSEYNIVSVSLLSKLGNAYLYFKNISPISVLLLPLLHIILLSDTKKKLNSHRLIYIILSLLIATSYMLGIYENAQERVIYSCFFSLPFAVFSGACYILTEKRNTVLFYCMWMPAVIAAFFHFFASNTFLLSLGIVFAVSNTAGVIFVKDLFSEIKTDIKKKSALKQTNKIVVLTKVILCVGLCAQFIFQGYVLQYGQIPYEKTAKAISGPYSGTLMTEKQHHAYTNVISDIDYIKSINTEKLPVYIASYKNWIYMYNDSPIAAYTAWFTDTTDKEQLIEYYKKNPDKIPKYIYIDPFDFNDNHRPDMAESNINSLSTLFEFAQEELSNGTLLTVEKIKF